MYLKFLYNLIIFKDCDVELKKTFELWNEWRQISVEYLSEFYKRFDVAHNEWSYESEQVKNAHLLTQKLIDDNIAFCTADKFWAIHDQYISGKVVIKKSDNSSLYLSRLVFIIICFLNIKFYLK